MSTSLPTIIPFDDDWRFALGSFNESAGDLPSAVSFDDSHWRQLSVPHDWSIEDLSPRNATNDVFECRNGTWLFKRGGENASWQEPSLDDSGWLRTSVPSDWREAANYTDENAFGWFRRHIDATSEQVAASSLVLALGAVSKRDTTYLNGEEIGQTGSFKPACSDYLRYRAYRIPAGLLKLTDNVVAVRVFSEGGQMPGGLYDHPTIRNGDVREGAFDPALSAGGRATGYTLGGVGWYRKHFTTPEGLTEGAVATLTFDGVYMNSELYLNGAHVRSQPYGYSTFVVDVSSWLNRTVHGANVLALRVDNSGRNSRWFSGSGIYRHVRLTVRDALHFATWGVAISTPEVSASRASVQVDATVSSTRAHAASVAVAVAVAEPEGRGVARATAQLSVPAAGSATASLRLTVHSPRLWGPDSPSLYQAHLSLTEAVEEVEEAATEAETEEAAQAAGAAAARASGRYSGRMLDSTTESFGIRSLAWDASFGLRLNGKTITLRGGCVHHDNGPLGAATIERAETRRVELLKANGYNAIRTSHNPVSPAFLAACDRLGMLVMDEAFDCWSRGKNRDDYHLDFDSWWRRDLAAMVLRDRNHPSVIMWSIGNEIPIRASPLGYNLSAQLSAFVRARDPSRRPVTSAYPGVDEQADPYFEHLDIAGYNYSPQQYAPDHARLPARLIVATESFPADSYDYWQGVWAHAWVVGDFVWTALDYIGESAIGNAAYTSDADPLGACFTYDTSWSWHTAYCGDLDICGFKKPQSHYRNVLWGLSGLEVVTHDPAPPGATEHVSSWGWPNEEVSWTWPGAEGQPLTVKVYTWQPNVTLLLDGRVVGRAGGSDLARLTAKFVVPFAAGNLTAIAHGGVSPPRVKTLLTAGPAAALRMSADREPICASRDDLAYVTVQVVDRAGRMLPRAQLPLSFALSGSAAELYRVGNGDPQDLGSFTAARRSTFRGRALAVLRPIAAGVAGQVRLSATAPGLRPASLVVRIDPAACVV